MMMLLWSKLVNTVQCMLNEERGSADDVLPVFGKIVLSIAILIVLYLLLKTLLPGLLNYVITFIENNL